MVYTRRVFLCVGIILTAIGIVEFFTDIDTMFADENMIKGFIGNMIGLSSGIVLIIINRKPDKVNSVKPEVSPK